MRNTQTNTQQKESPRFKLIVPEDVNKQFKYLLKKFPSTEWSGTLFYDIEGDYSETFTATVKGFYLQDIGSSAFTSFQESPELVSYMLEKDLIDCNRGLCHSHHNMQTFFSGTDMDTLNKEAKNYNHFLSLIVNTAQEYSTKMSTLKIQEIEFSGTIVYYTFNGIKHEKKFENQTKKDETIEIITGVVEIEQSPSEAFEELDSIIKELQSKAAPIITYGSRSVGMYDGIYDYDDGYYNNYREFGQPINKAQNNLFNNTGMSKQQVINNKKGKKGFKKETTNHTNANKKPFISFQDELAVKRYAKAIFHNALLECIQTADPVVAIQHNIIPIVTPEWKDEAFFNAIGNIDKMSEALEDAIFQETINLNKDFPEFIIKEQESLMEDLLLSLKIQLMDIVLISLVEEIIESELYELASKIKPILTSQKLMEILEPQVVL